MFKPKNIIEISNTLLMTILFSVVGFAVYGGVMIYKTLLPFTQQENSIEYDNFIERTEIFDNVFLDHIYSSDSINGNQSYFELYFLDELYNSEQNIFGEKFNLKDNPKSKYTILFLTLYYLLITIAWLIVFSNLYMFAVTQDDSLTFYKKNSKRLLLSARIIEGIAIFKFFGLGIISIIIGKMLNEYIQLTSYSYEFFTGFILLVLIAGLLKVIASAYKKAHQIEEEQELTV
jgi:hypothetical protein